MTVFLRARTTVLAGALSLTLLGAVTAATRSTTPTAISVTASAPEGSVVPDVDVAPAVAETTTSTTAGTVTTPHRSAGPSPPKKTSTKAAPSDTSATGTIVSLSDAGIYVFDTATGTVRRAADVGPFDVNGSTLYVAHGTTITKQPVTGGAASAVTVAGANDLKWIEASPAGMFLTMWATHPSPSVAYLHDAVVDASGAVVASDVGEDRQVEWSPDGSYFVLSDYRGLRALKADGTPLWGPIAAPEQDATDIAFSPDGDHVVVVFGHYKTFSLDVAAQTWAPVAVQNSVSFANDGRFAATPPTPAGWDGRNQLGTIIGDLSGHSEVLSKTGTEPELSPTGTLALMLDKPIGANAFDDHENTLRLVDLSGTTLYTLTHHGSVFGRDGFRHNNTQSNWVEGPRWSDDGRYVVVGLSDLM